MEGPSLYLAAQQLQPFCNQPILAVSGDSKIGIHRLDGLTLHDIFSWGKHLIFQCDGLALRVHFMLFGSFEATVNGLTVTGDYKRARTPRLYLQLPNGEINFFSCSLKYLETPDARSTYDFTLDVMSDQWDPKQALKHVLAHPNEQIGDVLLDQKIFSGVGNIIRIEILFLARVHPATKVKDLSPAKLRKLIQLARSFSFQFYEWRKQFVLRKSLVLYGRSTCPQCGGKVTRTHLGKRNRRTYFCPHCQPAVS